MPSAVERLQLLQGNADSYTGIDFVHIVEPCEQTELHIFFHTDLSELTNPLSGAGRLLPGNILIESELDENLPAIAVTEIVEVEDPPSSSVFTQAQFDEDLKRWFIAVRVEEPGDFTRYRLRIEDPLANTDPTQAPFSRIDQFFNNVGFSFKVACEDNRDCLPPGIICPVEVPVDFPVDYMARDFVSFRNALLDYAAQKYPQWAFPMEADVGVMLAEVFAALGDEFSYIQERYAREAFLETANQRRSLRKKARLLDFEIHDGLSADTLLDVFIDASGFPGGTDFEITAGDSVWASSEGLAPIPFEVGKGIHDRDELGELEKYKVRDGWNLGALSPFCFDESQICLPVGATELFVEGEVEDAEQLQEGDRFMLLKVDPPNAGVAARRIFVRIEEITVTFDPLLSQTVSRIKWADEDALRFQINQEFLTLSLNIVPATAGETLMAEFVTGADSSTPFGTAEAVQRQGPLKAFENERPPIFFFGLPETDNVGLGFLGAALRSTTPELRVESLGTGGELWRFQRTLIGAAPGDNVVTLEDGIWRQIRSFNRAGDVFAHQDYATGAGFSLRFGDGEFGAIPPEGTLFRVTYRSGPGRIANVPGGSITALEIPGKARELPAFVESITNPLEVTTGVDPESQKDIKMLTPEAYRAQTYFAVQPGDYGEQAERLDFIQTAEGTQRYTGSWNSIFVAGDALGSNTLTDEQTEQLVGWMDCVRQAGRDVIVKEPKSAPIDLEIRVCIEAFAHPGEVLDQVEEVLLGPGVAGRVKGFFHPDNFTFRTFLQRSALEAVIQAVPGVRAVRRMRVRVRGSRRFSDFNEMHLEIQPDEILRLDNDPLRPGNGTLTLIPEGGA